MDRDIYKTVWYENASGEIARLSDADNKYCFELGGRSGFSAPEVEIVTQKYANGVTKIISRQLSPRSVTLNLIVAGASRAHADNLFFELVKKLMNVKGGDTGRLYVRRSDGSTVYLNCAYSSGLRIAEEYRRFRKFTVEFYATDPYFYRDLPSIVNIAAGRRLTLSDTLVLGTKKIGQVDLEGSSTVENKGQEDIQPVIRINGVTGTVQIVNNTTNDTIAFSGLTLASDETLVIDTRDTNKSIYILDGTGNTAPAGQYLDWENLDFDFPLVPGENVISYSGGTGSSIDLLEISGAERFLSA